MSEAAGHSGHTYLFKRFVNDVALQANTEIELEEALNVTGTVLNNYNMKINIRKTKVIACKTKSGKKRLNIKIGNEKIEEISDFCYDCTFGYAAFPRWVRKLSIEKYSRISVYMTRRSIIYSEQQLPLL